MLWMLWLYAFDLWFGYLLILIFFVTFILSDIWLWLIGCILLVAEDTDIFGFGTPTFLDPTERRYVSVTVSYTATLKIRSRNMTTGAQRLPNVVSDPGITSLLISLQDQ